MAKGFGDLIDELRRQAPEMEARIAERRAAERQPLLEKLAELSRKMGEHQTAPLALELEQRTLREQLAATGWKPPN
jgi:hypothetical protein